MGKHHAWRGPANRLTLRVLFYAPSGYRSHEPFRYLYAHVAARFPDHAVIMLRRGRTTLPSRLRRWRRKIERLGPLRALEVISSYPLQRYFAGRDRRSAWDRLRAMPRPPGSPDRCRAVEVDSLNGPRTADAIRELAPDVMIQAGAGILRSEIFSIPRLGTVNMHHGIAPPIRGMASIYWALWERRRDWIGATIHMIDEGLDTGRVLAYGRPESIDASDDFPRLYAEATRRGVEQLLRVLDRFDAGQEVQFEPASGEGQYRSTFSGWKHLILNLRSRMRA